jgi:isopenicillin N synthase-like dioxygenase
VNTVLAPVFWQPAQAIDHAQERFGVAPPKDFRVLTLLLKEISGGLQLRTRSGDWIEAPPIEGTLVCNNGDLLQRWSNDRF